MFDQLVLKVVAAPTNCPSSNVHQVSTRILSANQQNQPAVVGLFFQLLYISEVAPHG